MNVMLLRLALLAGACASLATEGCIHITNTYTGPPAITERTTETRSIADARDCGCGRHMGYFPYYPAPPAGYAPPTTYPRDGYASGPSYYPVPYGYPYGYPHYYGGHPGGGSQPTNTPMGGEVSRSDQRHGQESGERRDPDVRGGLEQPVEAVPTARRDDPMTDGTPAWRPEDHRTPPIVHEAPGPRNTDDRPMTSGGSGGVSVGRRDEGMIGGEGIKRDEGVRGTDGMRRDEGMRSQERRDVEITTKPAETRRDEGMRSQEKRDVGIITKPADERRSETTKNEGMQSREQRDIPATPKPVEVKNNESVESREQRDIPATPKAVEVRNDEGARSRERRDIHVTPQPETRNDAGVTSRQQRDVPVVTQPVETRREEAKPQEQRNVQVTPKPAEDKPKETPAATPTQQGGTEAGVRRATDTNSVSQVRRGKKEDE